MEEAAGGRAKQFAACVSKGTDGKSLDPSDMVPTRGGVQLFDEGVSLAGPDGPVSSRRNMRRGPNSGMARPYTTRYQPVASRCEESSTVFHVPQPTTATDQKQSKTSKIHQANHPLISLFCNSDCDDIIEYVVDFGCDTNSIICRYYVQKLFGNDISYDTL